MPHLVLEYSVNVPDRPDFEDLLRRLQDALSTSSGFEIEKMKSRAVARDRFRVADGAPDRAFVHLAVSLLEGRQRDDLRRAGQALLEILQGAFPRARAEQRCDVTLEIREMAQALYFKAPPRR